MPEKLHADEIRVVHAIPGRVRVKIARIKSDPELAEELHRALSAHPAVQSVEVSPITGSVLVHYDSGEIEAVSRGFGIDDADFPALPESFGEPSHRREAADWGGAIADKLNAVNDRVRRATGGPDLKLLIPAALLLLGVHRIAVAKSLASPRWYEFFWFCFNTFVSLNRKGGRD